jgi:hypothetical protein
MAWGFAKKRTKRLWSFRPGYDGKVNQPNLVSIHSVKNLKVMVMRTEKFDEVQALATI